jgi:hypothetical protein
MNRARSRPPNDRLVQELGGVDLGGRRQAVTEVKELHLRRIRRRLTSESALHGAVLWNGEGARNGGCRPAVALAQAGGMEWLPRITSSGSYSALTLRSRA